jgi:Domain of unknown function (DUF3784)
MFVAQAMFVAIGLFMIILGLLVWKKRCYKFIAGYVEGSVKNEDQFGRVNGIFVILMGIVTIIFSFFMDLLSVWVFIGILVVIVLSQIVINGKMADKS